MIQKWPPPEGGWKAREHTGQGCELGRIRVGRGLAIPSATLVGQVKVRMAIRLIPDAARLP